MQIVSIPQEVLEVAYTVRNQYPDLTPEEVAIELLKQSVEAEKSLSGKRKRQVHPVPEELIEDLFDEKQRNGELN